jgi:hypothetical protein
MSYLMHSTDISLSTSDDCVRHQYNNIERKRSRHLSTSIVNEMFSRTSKSTYRNVRYSLFEDMTMSLLSARALSFDETQFDLLKRKKMDRTCAFRDRTNELTH